MNKQSELKRIGFLCGIAAYGLVSFTTIFGSNANGQSPWPNWLGPNGDGSASPGQYATEWSESKNIAWKMPLSGRGASTPIIAGNKIYMTLGEQDTNTLLCLDLDGKELWRKTFGKERPAKHAKASGSNSSPTTDGKDVFVYFKSGDVASVSLDGTVNWQFNLQEKYGEDSLWWDLGTSPVLTKNALVIAVMQTGPSFLVALNKADGSELWKADRWLDVPEEANQSYTTPALVRHKEGETLYTVGADHVTAHSAVDGSLLWKIGGFNPGADKYFRSIASPVATNGFVICPYSRGATLTGIKTDVGIPSDKRVAWQKDFGSDVPTPAVYDGRIYLLGDKGLVTCLKPDSGEIVWTTQLPKSNRQFSSSPIVADGKLFCTREDATTFVLSLENEGQIVSTNKLEGNAVATPVFAENKIFLRTFEAIYAIKL